MVFFSNDMLTLLITFEWMSIFSFFIISYYRSESSLKAARFFLTFSLFSGLLIFGAIIFSRDPSLGHLSYWLMSIGFLIKCGAFPFHVWLAKAHPAAPHPASAILSGSLVKVGFFGLLQTMTLYNPDDMVFGVFMVSIALISMLLGVSQALLQTNAKKMLAYHSVSQMGYVLLGFGLWFITQSQIALLGALLHAMNHAYFKSSLFLSMGVIAQEYKTDYIDMYKIKGFFQKSPWVSMLFLIAILGISGAPFFNGFVSKALLHEELSHYHFSYPFFRQIEALFILTAIGTFVSVFKLYYLVNRRIENIKICWKNINLYQIIPLLLLSTFIVLFGVNPSLYQNLIPLSFRQASVLFLEQIAPFQTLFTHNVPEILLIDFSGIVFIFFGFKTGFFHMKIPHYTLYAWYLMTEAIHQYFFQSIKYSDKLIINYYKNASILMNKVFAISCTREGCDCLRYNDFIEKHGKVLVAWLLGLILIGTILFVWVYLGYLA